MSTRLSPRGAGLTCALVFVTALGGATSASARVETCVVHGNRATHCEPGRRVGHYKHRDRHDERVIVVHRPRVGERIHGGEVVEYRRYRRLPPPPRHQEYRVIDNRVVRVDTQTLQVMAIIGLASALLANN